MPYDAPVREGRVHTGWTRFKWLTSIDAPDARTPESALLVRWHRLLMAATISCSSDVRCGAHGAGSGCTDIALHFVLAPQHCHVLLNAWVTHLDTLQSTQNITCRFVACMAVAAAHPFHSPTRAAPRTSAHATAPRCLPCPALAVASNHLNPSEFTMMNLWQAAVNAHDDT